MVQKKPARGERGTMDTPTIGNLSQVIAIAALEYIMFTAQLDTEGIVKGSAT